MANLTCDKDELMALGPCIACLSEHQMLAVIAVAFCKFSGGDPDAECDPAVLLEDAKCLTCLNEKQMLQAIVALIVNWGMENGFLRPLTDLRADASCMLCLSPRQLKAILLNQLCTGIAAGNVFCFRPQ